MTLRTDRRVVDQIVKFATRDPKADGDVLVEMARRFPPEVGDSFDEAANHPRCRFRREARARERHPHRSRRQSDSA